MINTIFDIGAKLKNHHNNKHYYLEFQFGLIYQKQNILMCSQLQIHGKVHGIVRTLQIKITFKIHVRYKKALIKKIQNLVKAIE